MPETTAALFLTKLLPLAVYPLGLALLLGMVGALCMLYRYRRTATMLTIAGSGVLWICAMPAFAAWAKASLERQYPPQVLAAVPGADVAIVLGGAVGQPVPPRMAIDLSAASDRVLHAARLYRAGKVRRVLVTGGNIPWLASARSEAELIRDLLVEWGVPTDAIDIAGASRNTYENALEIVAMRQRAPFASALLVTSAAHMPRAMAVFRRAGLSVMAATTDVEVVDNADRSILRWFPDAGALAMTTDAVKEWIGLWVYRTRGYA
jgi:uncharacterized SAM-binding protein YcdF (DUF218 family)